jgi:hypothetical protein
MFGPLTEPEKDQWATIQAFADSPTMTLLRARMLGRDIAVVCDVVVQDGDEPTLDIVPLAILVDDDLLGRMEGTDPNS